MQHPHDFNAVFDGSVENKITAHGKTSQACGQLLPLASQMWMLSK
jgi:hypothetical protein